MSSVFKITVVAGLAFALTSAGMGIAAVAKSEQSVVDSSGNLRVPENYREKYQSIGTWSVANDEGTGGAKEMHSVFASPGAVAAYLKTGHFPDGTVLVKEVYGAATGSMTTGTVSHEDSLKGWFVMVRDSQGTHPGNKLWGDGWGWSWFDADKPTKTTSTDYNKDCLPCHVPAKNTDWIYVHGYPALKQ